MAHLLSVSHLIDRTTFADSSCERFLVVGDADTPITCGGLQRNRTPGAATPRPRMQPHTVPRHTVWRTAQRWDTPRGEVEKARTKETSQVPPRPCNAPKRGCPVLLATGCTLRCAGEHPRRPPPACTDGAGRYTKSVSK